MKVAYIFRTNMASTFQLSTMILPQLETNTHLVNVLGMFFFDDNINCLRQNDPIGERLAKIAKEKNMLAFEYYKRFDNMFTGPGKIDRGLIEPLPRNQTLEEFTKNLLICSPQEMIDKLGVYAEAGVDEFIISASFGQSQKELIDSMQRINKEVMPFFKKINNKVA